MKKIFLIAILSFLLFKPSFSQNKDDNRFSLVVSPVVSWMRTDNPTIDGTSAITGINFGVIYDKFFGDNYAISTGVSIVNTGGKLKHFANESSAAQIVDTYKLRYLEIPIGLKLRSADFRQINIYADLGVAPQFKMKAVDKKNNSWKNDIRHVDLSYYLGGGIEYSLNSKNALLLGARFNNGLLDITKVKDRTILNRLSFNLGFIF